MSRSVVGLFALLCIAQLWLPASMIVEHERTLSAGELFRFRAGIVDPADPFVGRYVLVSLEAVADRDVERQFEDRIEPDRLYWAELGVDGEGFARIVAIEENPRAGAVAVRDRGPVERDPAAPEARGRRFALVADRYYLNERLAPEAERVWRDRVRLGTPESPQAWAEVRVLRGRAAIVALWIGDERIEQAVRAP